MKKIMITIAAIVCCAMISTTLIACGGDDSDKGGNGDPSVDKTPSIVSMTFSSDVNADMLEYFDIVMIYNDGTGEKQETITTNKWTKTLTAKLPASFSFKRQIRVKANKYDALVAATKVTTTKQYSYVYEIFNAAGKPVDKADLYKSVSGSVDGVGELVAKQVDAGKLDQNWAFVFNANGKLVSTAAAE